MGASWISYNGVDSRTLGVIIAQMPSFGRGAERYSKTDIPALDGSIFVRDGAYSTFNTQVVINCFGAVSPSVVYNWLSGEGWLTTSDDPTKKRYVRFFDEVKNDRWRDPSIYDIITAPMICDPFCYKLNEETVTTTSNTSYLYITNEGTYSQKPVITINCDVTYGYDPDYIEEVGVDNSGAILKGINVVLSIGNKSLNIANVYDKMIIDFERRDIYYLPVTGFPGIVRPQQRNTVLTFGDYSTFWNPINAGQRVGYLLTKSSGYTSHTASITIKPNMRWF